MALKFAIQKLQTGPACSLETANVENHKSRLSAFLRWKILRQFRMLSLCCTVLIHGMRKDEREGRSISGG